MEEKQLFGGFLLSEGLLSRGGGGEFKSAFHSFSGREASSRPLGTLARRSSSRRRLLAWLVLAFSKRGSRLASRSLSFPKDFVESK